MGIFPFRFRHENNQRLWQLHDQLRFGNSLLVAVELRKIARRGVPPQARAEFANLAWRAGVPELGARVLSRIVHAQGRQHEPATTTETAEYAACLLRLGTTEEPQDLLSRLPHKGGDLAGLYLAYVHIAKWEYAEAIPLLLSYLKEAQPEPYERLVAQVNLASALVYERQFLKAKVLLREILHEASVKRLSLALGVALELSAGNFILQGKLNDAEPFLDRAQRELSQGGDLVPLFIRKWRAILGFLRKPSPRPKALEEICREAAKVGHWETIRDCDRFRALALHDVPLALRLYFGTPFASFRRRLLADFGDLALPEAYTWELGEGKRPLILHLKSAEVEGRRATLKLGQLNHRLLGVLSSDFYRPFRVATLHRALYSDAFFNPTSSPSQVHIAVRRLRRWFRGAGLPLEIQESGGAYRIIAKGAVRVLVPAPGQTTRLPPQLGALKQRCPREDLSVADAVTALGLPRRSAQRLLAEAESRGFLMRVGAGRSTRYRWR